MTFNSFFKTVFLTVTITFFVSCDKDFNEIGADIIDDGHYNFNLDDTKSIVAYNQLTGVVQSNNLPINSLGYNKNGVFGKTTASFVTQLELETLDPKFYGVDSVARIDSVYLHVPYYSTKLETATDGAGKYELDSIQPQKEADQKKINLGVYRSGYYLRSLDPSSTSGLTQAQVYYNNDTAIETATSFTSKLNNDSRTAQNTEFVFSKNEIVILKNNTPLGSGTVKERLAPGIYMDLDKQSFLNDIINAPVGKLANNDTFKDYYKGLFFKAENVGDEGTMAQLDFSKGKIVIVYHGKDSNLATDPYKRKTLTLNMKGNTVNLIQNTGFSPTYSGNTTLGNDKLFLKGGQGSMAIINLFGADADNNGTADQIEEIKANNWLINEANITFKIDQTAMAGIIEEPNRIYLYDIDNKRPLLDYYVDATSNSSKPKYAKYIHGGIITKVGDEGTEYKIRITNHIRNIIKNDSTNVRLGLVVTESIATATNAKLLTNFNVGTFENKYIPVMSVVNPLGTILFGNNIPVGDVNYDKRLKLQIYYTKPD